MRAVFLWLPVLIVMAVIFTLSAQPVLPVAAGTPDWLHHGLAFGGLAVVSVRACAGGRWAGLGPAAILAAWLIAAAYGVSDEWHQSFVPGRTPDVRDLVADCAGAALALAGVWAWGTIRRSP